ncbi:MAG TPA: sigma factor, partial [Rhodanobacteraceae bacterium]|nr:sigma factor [Rhodanobacteraceae bacterium]
QALAEDCTQEAFVQAWKALPRFRRDSAFGSWLHRIAVNVVVGHQRTALRRSAWMRDDGDDALDACAAPIERPDVALDLDRAIAELTGLAVGTCKAHLHRARRLLRERLTA